MIGYVTFGSNDLPRVFAFYDALLAELGARRTFDSETFVAWNVKRGPALASSAARLRLSPNRTTASQRQPTTASGWRSR